MWQFKMEVETTVCKHGNRFLYRKVIEVKEIVVGMRHNEGE